MEAVKQSFQKIFMLERVLLKSSGFSELKICLLVNKKPKHKGKATFVPTYFCTRPQSAACSSCVWFLFFFFYSIFFVLGRMCRHSSIFAHIDASDGSIVSGQTKCSNDFSPSGKRAAAPTCLSSAAGWYFMQPCATLMLPLTGFVWRHQSASQRRPRSRTTPTRGSRWRAADALRWWQMSRRPC